MKSPFLSLCCLLLLPIGNYAQLEPSSSPSVVSVIPTSASLSYIQYNGTRTISTNGTLQTPGPDGSPGIINMTLTSGATETVQEVTLIAGGSKTTQNATQTSTSVRPTNTQPCNNYAEFCTRKYSNITEVAAHNSPFVVPRNVFSNQHYGVVQQLNDGIRMLQAQAHWRNNTMYLCHSDCDFLNAGPLVNFLRTVSNWLQKHPYDVVTILLGNANFVDVGNFSRAIQDSGIGPLLYVPPEIPMGLDDWPTLGEMILRGKRVVFFLDYRANQEEVPYVLDEFSQMWETPFSPTNTSFPCTVHRPPGLSPEQARDRLYLANHNLNTELSIADVDVLLPNVAWINQTNAVSGNMSLGLMANECTMDWGRPPNFLLVDFYDEGGGSVFEVAAQMNNVTYDRACCGKPSSGGSAVATSGLHLVAPVLFALVFTM